MTKRPTAEEYAYALERRLMDKPVVHYRELYFCEVGKPALLLPLDHPGPRVTNTRPVLTSMVIRHDAESGEFETRNTVYRPLPTVH